MENRVSLVESKGKLITCTVHGRTTMEGVDVQLFCVGKPKGKTYYKWWTPKPALAPSPELVTFTKSHNRSKGHLPGWFERYTESLLEEWRNSEDFLKAFSQLIQWLREGKVVAVSCYCDPHKRSECHLSILADLVRDFGFTVQEADPIAYDK
jgi:hypothetical protein